MAMDIIIGKKVDPMNREYSSTKTLKREHYEEDGMMNLDLMRMIDDMFYGLRRFWIAFVVILSVCSSVSYVYEKSTFVPEYYAASTFVVSRSTSVKYQETYYNKVTTEQIANAFPYIIMNDALQHLIAEDLGVSKVNGEINAVALEDTNIITLSVVAGTPDDAYNILQSVIENYPQIARSVVGETELNIIDETGKPVSPRNVVSSRSSGMKGIVVGAAICAVWLFIYALTRKTIRREDDFRTFLNIDCLCTLPLVKSKKRSKGHKKHMLVDDPHIDYGFIEANRTLRARVEKDASKKNAKVYLVSGAEAGEGKTMVATNLAMSLASKGKKVVLVDMDLRHPSVMETVGLEKTDVGTVDVLQENVSAKDVLIRYKKTSLYILPGGKAVSDPTRILNRKKIGDLCQILRKSADYVIIDTPPSSLLSDASQLVKAADAGIFVVKQDYATYDSIIEGIEMLTDAGLRLAGCVLNCAEIGITGYGNGYGYGYGLYGYRSYGDYGRYGKKNGSKYMRRSEDDEEEE